MISAGEVVHNIHCIIITPLLVTYVIAVVSIHMGFQELAPISSKLIIILLTLLYISEI